MEDTATATVTTPGENITFSLSVPPGRTVGENLNPSLTFEGTFKEDRKALEPLVAINFKLVANHRGEKRKEVREKIIESIKSQVEDHTKFVLDRSGNGNLVLLKEFLVLIYHVRDIREGKGERDLFHFTFCLLVPHIDPMTCQKLLKILPEYGYFKDLLRIAEYGYKDIREMVIDIIADQLVQDQKAMTGGKPVSLCGKYAPRDRKKGPYVQLAQPLALKIGQLCGIKRSQFTAYRKLIVQLSRHIDVTEQKMSGQDWSHIDPKRVPSICMKTNRHNFLFEDKNGELKAASVPEDRAKCREIFLEYTKKALKGEAKLTGRTLQPHEFIVELWGENIPKDQLDMLEAQWMDLRNAVKESGKMGRYCIISDVSGSMQGTPMMVAVGLGILVSEVVDQPFADKIMCFSAQPHWYDLSKCDTLDRKVKYLQEASNGGDWGGNTDFEKAIELMIETAKGKTSGPAAELPEYLLVLSDMQFDLAISNRQNDPWELTYERIQRKVKESGFTKVPTIVFWNLRGNTSDFPAQANAKGTILLSGFSAMILKQLMNNELDKVSDPLAMLKMTLNNSRYEMVRKTLDDLRLLATPRIKENASGADSEEPTGPDDQEMQDPSDENIGLQTRYRF